MEILDKLFMSAFSISNKTTHSYKMIIQSDTHMLHNALSQHLNVGRQCTRLSALNSNEFEMSLIHMVFFLSVTNLPNRLTLC